MFKKFVTFFAGFALLCVVGGIVYADACGLFVQDDEAAKRLVDRYMSTVMKNYNSDGEKVSFRGIVKEGCDFWYYNDYNNKSIAQNHSQGSGLEVENTDYSIRYDSVKYSNRCYTIDATVTREVNYKNCDEPVKNVSKHTFTIEQNGNAMYIINDVTQVRGDALLPEGFQLQYDTADSPAVR